MLPVRFSCLAGILLLSVSGCAAVPLAQLAVSQMAPVNQNCPGCSGGMTPGSYGDIAKGVSDSLRKLAAATADNQRPMNDTPIK